MSENQTSEATQQIAVPKTRKELLLEKHAALLTKYNNLGANINELANEINNIDFYASLAVDSVVAVTVGKGDKAVVLKGTVLGIKTEGEGDDAVTKYKVAYGSGFEADVTVVTAGKLAPFAIPQGGQAQAV